MSAEAAGNRERRERVDEFSRLYAAGDEDSAFELAVGALDRGETFEPPFESIWWLAGRLREARRYRLGLQLVERAFERGFRGWRIDYLRALFSALCRQFDAALDLLERAIHEAPAEDAHRLKILRARFLAASGQAHQAVRNLREDLSFGVDPAEYADIAIRIAWRAKRDDIAQRWARKAAQHYGASADRSGEIARRYFNRGLWARAARAAEQALRIEPGNPELERVLCRSLAGEGRHVEAIAALEATLGNQPGWGEGWELLVRSLAAGGRKDEALAALGRAGRGLSADHIAVLRDEIGAMEVSAGLPPEPKPGQGSRKSRNPYEDEEVLFRLENIPPDFVPRWTPETLAASGNVRRAFGSLVHSVRTLILRETMARFGRQDLGYLWAIIEPLIHVIVLSAIFYYIRMRDTLGMNPVLFVATGLIPLFFYLKTFGVLTGALRQNRPLLNHSRVQPMDIYLARSILEFFTQLLVLFLFVSVIYVAFEEFRFGSIFSIFANLFGLWIIGIGAGLAVGSLVVYAESLPNIVSGFNRIIYITSGVFFTLDRMPAQVAEYAAYNPLLHFVDGVRGNFNPLMGGSRVDIVYAYSWALAILAFGLIADRALRHRVLDR